MAKRKPPGNGKPFVKGDPRINRKGRPKVLPIQKALMAALLGHTEEEDLTKSEIAEVVRNMIAIAKSKKGYQSPAAVNAGKEILERVFGKSKTQEDEEATPKEVVWNETKTYVKPTTPRKKVAAKKKK